MSLTRDGTSPPTSRSRARADGHRHRATDPERRLWRHLRNRLAIAETHFRRQVPLGPYFADFCCLAEKSIVEVDGKQHGFDEQARKDLERTRFLEAQGFRVLRFSNREVMTDICVVLDTIHAALGGSTPTPDRAYGAARPSPQGGGSR